MNFSYRRRYGGPIQAVIFDWAGTTVDFGCMAPTDVFLEVFRGRGVTISMEEARVPMGAHKREHIRLLTEMDSVRRRWKDVHGRGPGEADVDDMFAEFVPKQIECLSRHSGLIPGTAETVEACRKRGYRIGSTTGYLKSMMEVVLRETGGRGYRPDAVVCADDVPAARPSPSMCLKNVIELQVWPVESCVKVDDTIAGIEEGLNAGMWSIGLGISGNEVGLCLEDWKALSEGERRRRREKAYLKMHRAGAHYVVDSIADLMPCLDDIEERLARGGKP